MPLRALRPNRSDRDLQRRSTLDPAAFFTRRSEKSSDHLTGPDRGVVSVDGPRPSSSCHVATPSADVDFDNDNARAKHNDDNDERISSNDRNHGDEEDDDNNNKNNDHHQHHRPSSPPIQAHTPNTRRFSLMRFRHASDPQLSVKAKEQQAAAAATAADDAPPVPIVPTNTEDSTSSTATTVPVTAVTVDPPAIITTAPTIVDNEDPLPKKRGRLAQFHLRRRSFDPTSTDRPTAMRKSMDKKTSLDVKRGPFSFIKSQNPQSDEPGRASTTLLPDILAESPHEETTSTLSLPVPRASESSRSDGSSGGHVSFEHTPRPSQKQAPKTHSGRLRFGRRNKQRASLFPLPVKITPPEFPDTAPATPRASTSNISSGSPHHSPGAESPPLTAIYRSRFHDHENGSGTHTLPPPTQVALTAASLNLAHPGSDLFRNDSTKSVHSSRSSPNATPVRHGLRGRSSTMGSLGGRSDDVPPPTPPYANAGSGRNSTSTVGRSSFSNLFGLSARFRQNSEPHSPRHGSPAHGFAGASGLSSHQNSLNISREALVLPEREEGETAGRYLERMEEINIDKSVIASILTKTDDVFMLSVLRSYMRKFAFFGDPIDMAIRKLLMQVELPKETQQIDRVLQGFADRYHECNPGIYINPDKAYFISFSIVILHTDFFNKNNKRKMQRTDYIKNSSCEGVSDDVLGCIYDNVVYTPFIHIEDEVDLKSSTSRRQKRTAVLKGPMATDSARKASKEPIDPYTLILEGKLDVLRPNIKDVMNLDDPYGYSGSAPTLDTRNLYKCFMRYGVIQIVSSRSRPEAFMSQSSQENPLDSSVGIVEMPVTKIGVLWRKDAKRKKARSPWQEWGAVLTGTGLSLFRNPNWIKALVHQYENHIKQGEGGAVLFQPPLHDFKPDHIIPMDGAVALVDHTYKKHKNAFVFFSKIGEETFLADNEKELTDWLGLLNYSAAFETLGVRPRELVGGLYEGQRNRGIRRLESSPSTHSIPTATGEVTIQSGEMDSEDAQEMMTLRRNTMQTRITESEERLTESIKQLEARLRDARHLQILAPIQPKTRELVIHAAGRLSAKLKWARIEIWRMKCHRDILAQELEQEKQTSNDRQSRIDRMAGTSSSPQPQLSPHQPGKPSKVNGLARLSSKTSSINMHHKPPLSPAASSIRPGTKSSRETDFGGDDIYRTPPETSRQSSPNHPSAHFSLPPISLDAEPSERLNSLSLANSPPRSPRLAPHAHRPSVSTMGDETVSSDAASDRSRYTTPPPIEGAKDEPHTPDRRPSNALRLDPGSESEADYAPAPLTGSPESKSRIRRSLQRTLRDGHGGSSHHRRGHKGRDSSSTVVSDDTQESEGLARGKGSFTVHGKKASVITFGPDWQNISAEERLKIRKQAQETSENSGHAEDKEESMDDQARSIVSDSTGTVFSAPTVNEPEDPTLRPAASEVWKQRHVSAQTITPANYHASQNGDATGGNDESEMSDIQEESPTTGRSPTQEKHHSNNANHDDDPDDRPIQITKSSRPQPVEA